MDNSLNELIKFEETLKNKANTKIPIYPIIRDSSIEYKVCDVVLGVSNQIKALQNADTKQKTKPKVHLPRSCGLLPFNVLSNRVLQEENDNNFETMGYVTDTQLFEIVKNAEEQQPKAGMTQEFDLTFCDKAIDNAISTSRQQDETYHKDGNSDNINLDENAEAFSDKNNPTHKNDFTEHQIMRVTAKNECDPYKAKCSSGCSEKVIIDTGQPFRELDCDLKNKNNSDVEILEENQQKSPILSKGKPIVFKTKKPIVCNLEDFEKFESLAVPIINESNDLKTAKKLINSQIVNHELCIGLNSNPLLKSRCESSPRSDLMNNNENKCDCVSSDCYKLSSSTQNNFEDEILFSSDEETKQLSKASEDLPLTCALETSFYNHSGVLDKTLYVGFQTASNKTIQVNSDSLLKAKGLLNEIENMDLNELVNMFDKSLISCENVVEENLGDIQNLSTSDKNTTCIGFKTANGKHISISETAMLKGKAILDDISSLPDSQSKSLDNKRKGQDYENTSTRIKKLKHCHYNNNNERPFTTCNPTIFEEELEIPDYNIIQEFETSLIEESNKEEHKKFKGFQTASFKPISISEEALKMTKAIFGDINEDLVTIPEPKPTELKQCIPVDNEKLKNCKSNSDFIFIDIEQPKTSSSTKEYNNRLSIDSSRNFTGFMTASKKEITISEEALLKTKVLFEGIDIEHKIHEELISEKPSELIEGLKSKNNEIKNSSYSSNDYNSNSSSSKTSVNIKGFSTASNKPINVSAKSLSKYKNIFQDIDIDIQSNENENMIVSTDANAQIAHKEPDFSVPNDCVKVPNHDYNAGTKCFKFLFQTASQKEVPICEESLAASKKLLAGHERNKTNSLYTENKIVANKTNPTGKFGGFHTASNKKVTVSKSALEKCKRIFDDIELNIDDGINEEINFCNTEKIEHTSDAKKQDSKEKIVLIEEHSTPKTNIIGFQTASNKAVAVSKEKLAQAKKLFDDIDIDNIVTDYKLSDFSKPELQPNAKTPNCAISKAQINFKTRTFKENNNHSDVTKASSKEYTNTNKNKSLIVCKEENDNFKNILDSQVINNFDETLATEDFLKDRTPFKCKRSGSPIISCPKAKRRRFEVPTSSKKVKKPVLIEANQFDNKNTYVFDKGYKRNKIYKLKDLKEIESKYKDIQSKENHSNNYPINFESILDFKFKSERNELSEDIWMSNNIIDMFNDCVNKKIIPPGWIENHLKLIIWKLISYEITYPNIFPCVCTVKNVLEQLKYRYDTELYKVKRSAIRKILEKDDIPSKIMVLCVAGVYVDGTYVSSVTNITNSIELLVTDGWYCIKACIDKVLAKYVYDGKICVGTKLVTHGAELVNCEQGIAPWEDTSSVRLKIFGNSTRRARWDARLGYHSNVAMLTQLSSVKPEGGKISKMRLFVTRVYPLLYVEKFDDGSTVTRSERLENVQQMKYETERQIVLEKIYEEVEKEFNQQESQDSESMDVDKKLESGSQIWKLMNKHRDPMEFRANLTESQLQLLLDYTRRRKDREIEEIQQRVKDKIRGSSLGVTRNVIPLMKIRVASIEKDFNVTKGMISIWRPNENLQEIIAEGKWVDAYNLYPTAIRYSEMQLSASRQSIFQNVDVNDVKYNAASDSLKRQCYPIKILATYPQLSTNYFEVDTAGLLFLIDPPNKEFENSKQLFQNAFLADENKNIICVNFWGGIKKFGFENVLETGQVIACVNLQRRSGNTMKSIAQYRATEFSYFTKSPKYDCLRNSLDELTKHLSRVDLKKFQEECIYIKNNFACVKNNKTDISPYRMNNSDYNISKNKIFIDFPSVKDPILNLSGLDFESTFKQKDTQEVSPQELLRKKKINEKIAKLKMYGEPPPLSPMNIINRSKNAANAFKSPLSTRGDNGKPLDKENSKVETSPVLPFRKYVKRPSVNPVKLNFNNVAQNDPESDPFADDFDASPPLSLDE